MERPEPLADWIVYAIVLGTVGAMLLGKWLMFFNDKDAKESEASQIDDTVEDILEESLEETLDKVIDEAKK